MSIQRLNNVSTQQQKIAEAAQKFSEPLTSLNHHLTISWLEEAYRKTRKNGATGIDNQTATDYFADLDENLKSLSDRARSGKYFAPPVKRTYIPKGPGSKELRGIGIPTFEDKVLQRAVAMILEPIFEQEFLDCSFGFRPGRSQHQAIDRIGEDIMKMRGCYVLEVDIRKFFDELDHKHLREIMQLRVNDGVINRLIGKWLNAGVFDQGSITYPEEGCPQGGVLSPLASNIYLNHVLDQWFEVEVKPRLQGEASLVRFADDFVIMFNCRNDALRVQEVLPKRLAKFGLRIHPDKTRLIDFRRPTLKEMREGKRRHGASFDFLGFTFYWGISRKRKWIVKRKTAKDRLKRSIKKAYEKCRRNRHKPVKEQCLKLNQMLRGHYQYFGVTGNQRSLRNFYMQVKRGWRKWLNRRDQRRKMPWKRFENLLVHHNLIEPYTPHSIYVI